MSDYPNAPDSAATLYNPVDRFSTKPLSTTLAVLCLSTDTTIQLAASVASLGGPATWGLVRIGDEEIIYEASSGAYIQSCHRGANGTAPIGHAAGSVLTWPSSALFLTALQAAVVAIQETLGTTGNFNFMEGATVIQSIQRGVATVDLSVSPQATVTITAVDMSKSIVVPGGIDWTPYGGAVVSARITLTSSTQVAIDVVCSDSNYQGTVSVAWQVVEFK